MGYLIVKNAAEDRHRDASMRKENLVIITTAAQRTATADGQFNHASAWQSTNDTRFSGPSEFKY